MTFRTMVRRLSSDKKESILECLSEDWQTAKEIAPKCGIPFQRVASELTSDFKSGLVESEWRSQGRGNMRRVYRRKQVLTQE
jgi:predicted DNA-binding ArsR family transcriptional regulator